MLVYLYICCKHLRLNPQVDLFPSMFSTQGPSKNVNVPMQKKRKLRSFSNLGGAKKKI